MPNPNTLQFYLLVLDVFGYSETDIALAVAAVVVVLKKLYLWWWCGLWWWLLCLM